MNLRPSPLIHSILEASRPTNKTSNDKELFPKYSSQKSFKMTPEVPNKRYDGEDLRNDNAKKDRTRTVSELSLPEPEDMNEDGRTDNQRRLSYAEKLAGTGLSLGSSRHKGLTGGTSRPKSAASSSHSGRGGLPPKPYTNRRPLSAASRSAGLLGTSTGGSNHLFAPIPVTPSTAPGSYFFNDEENGEPCLQAPENVALGTYTGSRPTSASAAHLDHLGSSHAGCTGAGLSAYTANADRSNRVKSVRSSSRASLARSRAMSISLPTMMGGFVAGDENSPGSKARRASTPASSAAVRTRKERQYGSGAYEEFCRVADKVSWVASGMGGAGATGGNVVGVQCFYDTSCYFKTRKGRPPKPFKAGPGSLMLIFQFYSKVQTPAAQYGKTLMFSDMQQVNTTLSFFELLLLLRDYCIVPQIVSKREVFVLWQIAFQEKVKRKQKKQSHTSGTGIKNSDLTYNEFLDMLTRIALLGFGKPGFRKEVENAEAEKLGIMDYESRAVSSKIKVTARAKVEFLANLMPLDSVEVIRKRLRSQGRETQGRINARAKGELSSFNVEEMRKGRQLARLSRLMAAQGLSNVDLIQRHAAFLTSTLEDDESVCREGTVEDHIPMTSRSEVQFGENDQNKIHKSKLKQGDLLVEKGDVGPDGLTPFQTECLKGFSRNLREVWEPYRYEESVHRWEEMPGPYLDLGAVLKGFSYQYKLKITNLSQSSVGIAVRARGLGRAVSVTYTQRTVPHGLSKMVKVALTTDVVDIGETFSFLDVEVTPTRMMLKPIVYSIPIYFKALVLNYGPESPELHPPGLHKPNRFDFPENEKNQQLAEMMLQNHSAPVLEQGWMAPDKEDYRETMNLPSPNSFGWGTHGFDQSR